MKLIWEAGNFDLKQKQESMGSNRKMAMYTGILFIAAILAYGIGNSLIGLPSDDPNALSVSTGALLMLLNSGIVVAIGLLLFPVLYAFRPTLAVAYLASRIIESVLLTVGIIGLLVLPTIGGAAVQSQKVDIPWEFTFMLVQKVNYLSYQIGMLFLGSGSLLLCSCLYRSGLLPRFLAVWGWIGYGGLFVGAVFELCGMPVGVWLALPGGIFELFLGFRLIFKGFNTVSDSLR